MTIPKTKVQFRDGTEYSKIARPIFEAHRINDRFGKYIKFKNRRPIFEAHRINDRFGKYIKLKKPTVAAAEA